jgi:pyruvate/2-oxoglutarate dehydrogenase complex dihydrolipoamide acyltransferase (E2) component
MGRIEVQLPELGLPKEPIRLTVWLAAGGSHVNRGEPILEVTAGAVTVDLPAPACGVLAARLAAEDDLLKTGDPVAIIETDV